MSETKLLPEQRDAAEDFFARVELPPLYDHELDELAEMLQFALTPKQEAAEAGCVTKPDPAVEAAIAVLIDYKADSGLVKQAERIVAAVRAADEKAGRA